MAPGRVAAQIRYNSKRAPCRDCPDAAKIMMAAPAGDLPAGRHLTGACGGAAYQVRVQLVRCWQCFSAARALGSSCYQLEDLISATRRIKRSGHVGQALLLAIEAVNFQRCAG